MLRELRIVYTNVTHVDKEGRRGDNGKMHKDKAYTQKKRIALNYNNVKKGIKRTFYEVLTRCLLIKANQQEF